MRCFLALDLPAPVRNYLARTARESVLKGTIKWVPAEQLHITLVFAGEVGDETVAALRAAVETVELSAMSFALAGLGRFPSHGEPRVIWAGLSGDVEPLKQLQKQLEATAIANGIERDKRKFSPHVTLGRVKSPFGAYAIVADLDRVGPTLRQKPFAATALTLYASELERGGPHYTALLRRPIA